VEELLVSQLFRSLVTKIIIVGNLVPIIVSQLLVVIKLQNA
jgi:hypothetical protein